MAKRFGILLVNLGTPRSPEPRDVYHYLNEFLTDKRVINSPWLTRQLLVRAFITPWRYKSSAKAYQQIWTPQGSPLLVYSKELQNKLQKELSEHYHVEIGMRYQSPSIENAIIKLLSKSIAKLIVIPLFPQYAPATTGSVVEAVMKSLSRQQNIPGTTFISHFDENQDLIDAFCERGKEHRFDEYDQILFSFHGLPEKQIKLADPLNHCLTVEDCCQKALKKNCCYAAQCYSLAASIAKQLNLSPKSYTICFQSRLGKEPWLSPYTSEVISQYAKRGKKILIFCPSFVCDCLETLYEIGVEYSHEFSKMGGKKLTLVEGLNTHPTWIKTLKNVILKNS